MLPPPEKSIFFTLRYLRCPLFKTIPLILSKLDASRFFANMQRGAGRVSSAIFIKIMNLDSLYSSLTVKTNAKLVLLVLDGLGDIATKENGFLTPLEAAKTPNLDAL